MLKRREKKVLYEIFWLADHEQWKIQGSDAQNNCEQGQNKIFLASILGAAFGANCWADF